MKELKVFIIVLTVLFASSFLSKESNAQGKWEIKSVTCPSSCKLNAKDLTFNVKIKNISNFKSTGDKVTVKVVISYNGNNLGGDEIDFTQGTVSNIGIGKTTTLNVLCTNENLREFTNVKGVKNVSVTFTLITETTIPAFTKNFSLNVKK
jgi:type 1 fimbria pilin